MHLLVRLRGGDPNHHQLGIAAGGKMAQEIREDTYNPHDWLRERVSFTFPVHILNSEAFGAVTGLDPAPSPISAETYAQAGLPFFDLYEEEGEGEGKGASGASGFANFKALKSVGQIEEERGLVGDGGGEPLQPGLVQPQRVVRIYQRPLAPMIWHNYEGRVLLRDSQP